MEKRGFYLATVSLIVCIAICWCKVTISGVSNICRNPDGRLGRCISKTKCYNHSGCDRNASNSECAHGHGEPPYVCCIFGNNIIFPDDDHDMRSMSSVTAAALNKSSLPSNVMVRSSETTTSSSNRRIFFPDENGNFNIAKVKLPEIGDRWSSKWLEHKDKIKLLPHPPVCGPMNVGDKIHGGVEAQLGEFPWLVNLEYRNEEGELQIGCAGNILNNKYVLTAGHCVKGPIEELLGKLESIRVGEHNTVTDEDCDDLGCIDKFERFFIIETIVHEEFHVTKRGRLFNDIALLKTDHNMTYSFSVAPVCLPNVINSSYPPITGSILRVAGWGDNGIEDFTVEKRIVDVPYVDNSECPLRVQPTQICAGGVTGMDSCIGDSGGSLARRTASGWVMEGIVSYGRKCGGDKPAVYTRVRNYIPWIVDNINDL
ncbi:serine protease 7-like [Musca autumnalis]|uniref:serine protease 7-like n=1 Tax=Musca autumnalis TaxID=221902 RepID=UPI003CED2A05